MGLAELVVESQARIDQDAVIRSFRITASQDGDAVALAGVVPSYYLKQRVQEVVLNLLRSGPTQPRLVNRVEVKKGKP